MSLNSKDIADTVISQLDRIGIDSKVGYDESHTAKLVRLIVNAIVNAIINDAQVIVTEVQTQGTGNMGGPVISTLAKTGKGVIK